MITSYPVGGISSKVILLEGGRESQPKGDDEYLRLTSVKKWRVIGGRKGVTHIHLVNPVSFLDDPR